VEAVVKASTSPPSTAPRPGFQKFVATTLVNTCGNKFKSPQSLAVSDMTVT